MLSQILIASTYPLEVVEAARWAEANKKLKGDALKAAVDKQSWDDSLKALAATSSVLSMMSEKLDWTQKLGDAVLAQQPDVMDAIQRLRTKAQANNKLSSNKQQTVSTQQQDGRQIITIVPAEPDTIYVPYYDPAVVYGPWPYTDYPPYYWPAPGYIAAGVIATGIAFGAGYALGAGPRAAIAGAAGMNWGANNILVNRPVNVNNINVNSNWTHNSVHRQGVRYNNANVAAKFGNRTNIASGAQNRMDFRGRNGQEVLRPGGSGAGNARPDNLGPGNRPGAGGAGTRDRAIVPALVRAKPVTVQALAALASVTLVTAVVEAATGQARRSAGRAVAVPARARSVAGVAAVDRARMAISALASGKSRSRPRPGVYGRRWRLSRRRRWWWLPRWWWRRRWLPGRRRGPSFRRTAQARYRLA